MDGLSFLGIVQRGTKAWDDPLLPEIGRAVPFVALPGERLDSGPFGLNKGVAHGVTVRTTLALATPDATSLAPSIPELSAHAHASGRLSRPTRP